MASQNVKCTHILLCTKGLLNYIDFFKLSSEIKQVSVTQFQTIPHI